MEIVCCRESDMGYGILKGGFCNMLAFYFDGCYAKFYQPYSTEIHVNVFGRVADLFRTTKTLRVRCCRDAGPAVHRIRIHQFGDRK